jgi:hypothetical protein
VVGSQVNATVVDPTAVLIERPSAAPAGVAVDQVNPTSRAGCPAVFFAAIVDDGVQLRPVNGGKGVAAASGQAASRETLRSAAST